MKTVVLTVVLLVVPVFSVGFIRGEISEDEEPANGRIKRHYGYHGSRPTYGGYQTVGGYQQQPLQQPTANQGQGQGQGPHPQSAHGGGEYNGYQRPNYNQGLGSIRSSGFYQQLGQPTYRHQPTYQYQQHHHGIMRYR